MLIELRDLPEGVTIKSIDCHIEFNGSGTEVSVKKVSTAAAPKIPEPKVEERPANIAPEMQDLKF